MHTFVRELSTFNYKCHFTLQDWESFHVPTFFVYTSLLVVLGSSASVIVIDKARIIVCGYATDTLFITINEPCRDCA